MEVELGFEGIDACQEIALHVVENGPFWQWLIYRRDELIQEGVSLSAPSARIDGAKVARYLANRPQD